MLSAIRNAHKAFEFHTWTFPIALFLSCLISFAPLIPKLGLYWDDWPSLWFLHFFGPSEFPTAFTIDRPLMGWLFAISTRLVGESIIAWQIFGIFTRWLSGMLFWITLRALWPANFLPVAGSALLFVVYPGFAQQYIPITYSHMFIVQAVFLLSIATMVWAFRYSRWFYPLILISLLSSIVAMFTLEYFFGLELIRPVILWMLLEKEDLNFTHRIKRAFMRWLPYVLLLVVFIFWRNNTSTPRANIIIFDLLRADPLLAISNLASTLIFDIIESSVFAWGQTLNFLQYLVYKPLINAIYLLIILVTAGVSSIYLARLRPTKESLSFPAPLGDRQWAKQAFLLGLFSLIIAGWPFWVTDLHIELRFPWDRFTLAMMPGVSLLVMGLITFFTKSQLQKAIIVGVLVGLAAGLHFQTALVYMRDWNLQKALFWQMVWRIPGLEPGTTLLTSELPFLSVTDNSLSAPLNWVYSPQEASREMPYMMIAVDARLGREIPSLVPGIVIEETYRSTSFKGSTSQAIVLIYAPPGCLKILDPEKDVSWPQKPVHIADGLSLSKLDLIDTHADPPASLPIQIFGAQPEPDWCYYFEKAELASQIGNWDEVGRLGDLAISMNKKFDGPEAAELTPYILGYSYTAQWEKAVQLTMNAYRAWPYLQDHLCITWQTIQENSPQNPEKELAFKTINQKLKCQSQ